MDSRLIAGAYSQHYRALEEQNSIIGTDKLDSIARAKKLSLETNKRRRSQAQKRKIEALREEKRRHEILSKRREEQKLATEKYQRSHIPPSARQHSGRRSPRRPGGGQTLEDALRLIRGSPRHSRPGSARDRVMSPRKENEDPFEKSYFEKRGHYTTRPGSGKISHQIDHHARAELMDYSLQNFTSSKTLFEQQLEQQQNLLLEQQQQSLREFNNAVQQEIDSDLTNYDGIEDGEEQKFSNFDDSCSSADSLEESKDSEWSQTGNSSYETQRVKSASIRTDVNHNIGSAQEHTESNKRNFQALEHTDLKEKPAAQFYLHEKSNESGSGHAPLNLDMTPSATYQGATTSALNSHGYTMNIPQVKNQLIPGEYKRDSQVSEQISKSKISNVSSGQISNQSHSKTTPLKQFSTDSLESVSSVSTVSLAKVPAHSSCPQTQAISNKDVNSTSSHVAWVSSSPNSENMPLIIPPNNTSNNNETGLEAYNPRYASAISLSIWPGPTGNTTSSGVSQISSSSSVTTQSVTNNTQPYGPKSSTISTTPPTSASVPRNTSSASTYSSAMLKSDAVLKSGIVGSGLTSGNQAPSQDVGNNSPGMDLNWQDLQYPLPQNCNLNMIGVQSLSGVQQQWPQVNGTTAVSCYNQNSQLPSSTLPSNNKVTGIHNVNSVPLHAVSQGLTANQVHSIQQPKQVDQQLKNSEIQIQQLAQNNQQQMRQFQTPQYQQKQNSSHQVFHPMQGMTTSVLTPGVPVPAVRTIFPHQRPPVPKTDLQGTNSLTTNATTRIAKPGEEPSYQQSNSDQSSEQKSSTTADNEQDDTEDEAPRIKGILKPPPGTSAYPPTVKAGGHPRDSLELMRLQGEKKPKKKSVHFAEDPTEEAAEEVKEPVRTKNLVVTNSGAPTYKPSVSRPASARVVSTTQKVDTAVGKVARAASAGVTRQMANAPTQISHSSSRNVSFSSGSVQTNSHQDTASITDNQNLQSAFPSSGQLTVLPTSSSVINRPKAAAHIIMSNPEQHGIGDKQGSGTSVGIPAATGQTASVAHKSLLDSKVKNINSFIGSRVPVKIPASASAVSVYHVARAEEDMSNNHQAQYQQQTYTAESGSHVSNMSAQEQRQILRDPSPASKRVPISNSVVTRTSIVPASTKISVHQTNMGVPSYSTSIAGGNINGNGGAVYDENGMRIDRTPTDEEITWLWDKVRNCLNKEDPPNGGSPGNGKVQNANGGGVDLGRQPPTMSTKLIDGASLGFGINTSPGVNGLRVGTGFFQPHPSPSVQNNKVRPALQQQGSYLRRYGLLKQRRVASATGSGSTPIQPPMAVQRASSAVHIRQHHQGGGFSPSSQPVEQDGPQPIAQAYTPQDGVSESTAAFIMAERLAKQSLSDSHIQTAMQDAHTKQEVHNTRSAKLAVNRGGHSALSIEEQNLLASLDKLNERLRVTDTHYTGTIQYHQPYQAHLPGFRSNQSQVTENRRNHPVSPRSLNQAQQRAQLARIRQQTRQYR